LTQVSGNSSARNPTNPGADFLNRRHKRVDERHGPKHGVPELCSHARVGCNSAGIVIRRASNQARTEDLQNPARLRVRFLMRRLFSASRGVTTRRLDLGSGCGSGTIRVFRGNHAPAVRRTRFVRTLFRGIKWIQESLEEKYL
jgi:hypothetical protein